MYLGDKCATRLEMVIRGQSAATHLSSEQVYSDSNVGRKQGIRMTYRSVRYRETVDRTTLQRYGDQL